MAGSKIRNTDHMSWPAVETCTTECEVSGAYPAPQWLYEMCGDAVTGVRALPIGTNMGAAASATFSGTFVKTAILARARDHLQRTRPPHELRVTTQPQAGTRPKF